VRRRFGSRYWGRTLRRSDTVNLDMKIRHYSGTGVRENGFAKKH
jgi:hypothetical protein